MTNEYIPAGGEIENRNRDLTKFLSDVDSKDLAQPIGQDRRLDSFNRTTHLVA